MRESLELIVGPLTNERGSALIVTILVLLIVTTLGLSASQTASTELEVAANYESSWRAFYAADGLAQASFNELIDLGRQLGRFPDAGELAAITLPAISDITVGHYALLPTAAATEGPLTSGYYQGLTAMTRPYEVELRAETSDYPPSTASVTMSTFFDILPIFQFAIFYEEDLEMLPGPEMTLTGRVHSNSDIYLGAGNSLTIDSNVTSAGDAFHRRKDTGARPGGAVAIRDGLGGFPGMNGLDSTHTDWVDESLSRWKGNIRTADHGITRLNLTIADPSNPHKIIEPAYDSDTPADRATKIAYSAEMNINIINGQGFDIDGNPLDLANAIAFDVLFDQREQKPMLVVEIDIDALGRLAEYPDGPAVVYIGSFEPGNGIPDWEIPTGNGALEEITQAIDDWVTNAFPGGNLPNKVRNALDQTTKGIEACLIPDLDTAFDKIKTAKGDIDDAIRRRQLRRVLGRVLKVLIDPIGTCDDIDGGGNAGSTSSWPDTWDGYRAPYDGGNTEFAVKIENGAELPDALTVVTANPAYIQGNYNSVEKKPSAIIADAITILSNAWGDDDLAYSQRDLNNRRASNTTMNAAFMLGNTETFPGAYNGGVENLPRFLERWSGRTFTYRGSLIDLWYSMNATGDWVYGSPVYQAPNRDWEFDTDLLDPSMLPPATPRVYAVRLREWRRD